MCRIKRPELGKAAELPQLAGDDSTTDSPVDRLVKDEITAVRA